MDYVEQEIHPRFVIQGSVHYDSKTEVFKDLQIESVKQASEVIRRLLAKHMAEESSGEDSRDERPEE